MRDTLSQYVQLPGLAFKAYTFTESDGSFGGLYLWKDLASARAWFSPSWFQPCCPAHWPATSPAWQGTERHPMKITDPGAEVLRAATQGDLGAIDRLLDAIQPGIHNLAVRMLGQREDAADATQEILLKVVTHLSGFRGEAAFTTWVWRVAHNHLMTARTRSAESPEVSLEAMAERLDAGLDFAARAAQTHGQPGPLTPQDKLEARQVALACTQSMLMSLDRDQRLVYLLDTVLDLPSQEAAAVVGITAQAYRQRLSRARQRLHGFMGQACGLVAHDAACRCDRQLPAVRHQRGGRAVVPIEQVVPIVPTMPMQATGHAAAAEAFDAFTRVSDAASVFRSHPEMQAPEALRAAIRWVLSREGFLPPESPPQ
ncbi:MAG TPA: sigma-70 family RNA polymerase sigma factor [Rubrivivax sp.]|nr:sigma-70 family RNA polymerase sigma factor [Rubrivivax sp.]